MGNLAMLKQLSLFIICFLVSATSYGQLPDDYGLKLSYGGSAQVFNEATIESQSTNARFDLGVALHLNWDFNKQFSILAEPGLVKRGMVGDFGGIANIKSSAESMNADLSYISLPVLAKFNILNSKFSPFVEAGPRIDFLIYERVTDNASSDYQHIIDQYNNITGGLSTGLGLDIQELNNGNLSLGLRLNWDLLNSYESNHLTVKNRASEFFLRFTL